MRPILYLLLASLLLPPSLGQGVPLTFGMRKLAFSANQFGIDLYRTMRHSEGNIAICPFCIDQSLLMTLLGAQGQSAMALRHVLYLWGMQPQELHTASHQLITHLGGHLRSTMFEDYMSRSAKSLKRFRRALDRYEESSVNKTDTSKEKKMKAKLLQQDKIKNDQYKNHQYYPTNSPFGQRSGTSPFHLEQLYPNHPNAQRVHPSNPIHPMDHRVPSLYHRLDNFHHEPPDAYRPLRPHAGPMFTRYPDLPQSSSSHGPQPASHNQQRSPLYVPVSASYISAADPFQGRERLLNDYRPGDSARGSRGPGTPLDNQVSSQVPHRYPSAYLPSRMPVSGATNRLYYMDNKIPQDMSKPSSVLAPAPPLGPRHYFHLERYRPMASHLYGMYQQPAIGGLHRPPEAYGGSSSFTSRYRPPSSTLSYGSGTYGAAASEPILSHLPYSSQMLPHRPYSHQQYTYESPHDSRPNGWRPSNYGKSKEQPDDEDWGNNLGKGDAQDNSDETELVLFNTIYVQREYAIKYPYQMYVYNYYNSSIHSLDFVMNGEEARQHINAIVEKRTRGRLHGLLRDVPQPSTNLLLISGLFLESVVDIDNLVPIEGVPWLTKSRQNLSKDDDVGHPMMLEARGVKVRYTRHDYLNCSAVEVPLRGGVITLLMITPDHIDDMGLLEDRLSAQRIADIMATMQISRANLKMPRIQIEHSHSNLTQSLSAMGLHNLFVPGRAELYDISEVRWLHITSVFHKSVLNIQGPPPKDELDEVLEKESQHHQKEANTKEQHGTKSTKKITKIPGHISEGLSIVLNRPFLYFVMDSISGLAIVMGKVTNP
ncbi:uncharacterized protein LOC111260614 isoform X2 [Varroa jacobsoni]|nr:uncharacterized protein LOC111260614 isoform X2 [Varroa jacobsoni]